MVSTSCAVATRIVIKLLHLLTQNVPALGRASNLWHPTTDLKLSDGGANMSTIVWRRNVKQLLISSIGSSGAAAPMPDDPAREQWCGLNHNRDDEVGQAGNRIWECAA